MIEAAVILYYIGFSQSIFAAFLIYTKNEKQTHDRVMILWLLTIGLRFWLLANQYFYKPYFNADFPITIIPLTFGPMLYLYTYYITKEKTRFRILQILHFTPFLVFASIYFFVEKQTFSTHFLPFNISFTSVFFASSILYSALVFIRLRIYRNRIKYNQFSYDSTENRLFWLNFIAILYVLTFSIYFITKFYLRSEHQHNASVEIISTIGLILFTYLVSYFGIKQQQLFKTNSDIEDDGIRTSLSTVLNTITKPVMPCEVVLKTDFADAIINSNEEQKTVCISIKKENDIVLDAEKIHQIELLKRCMETEKPYLQPDLSLAELANKIQIPKHHLTQLLNVHLEKNFFEFVNAYRIEEVKNRINNEHYNHLTLVAIAYDCGFNSKSTFNSFFKQHTGLTPTEYKQQLVDNASKD